MEKLEHFIFLVILVIAILTIAYIFDNYNYLVSSVSSTKIIKTNNITTNRANTRCTNTSREAIGKINASNIGLRERLNASLFFIDDLNCDGVTDLIVAKGDELSGVSLSHGEKRVLWKYDAKGSITALSVIESDEGAPVVLASFTYEGRIYALKMGQLLWTFSPSDEATRGSYLFIPIIKTGDLNGDGRDEVVAYEFYTTEMYALSQDGRLLWRIKVNQSVEGLTIADLNGDGKGEIVYSGYEPPEGTPFPQSVSYLLGLINGEGKSLWKVRDAAYRHSEPLVVDLDGDGTPEIVTGCREGLCVLNGEGVLEWTFKTSPGTFRPISGDLNGDGRPEIVFATVNGSVYAVSFDGGAVWRYDAGSMDSSPLMWDVDGDGQSEILIPCEDGLKVLSRNGTVEWVYGKESLSVAHADVDGDREGELLALTPSGLEVLDSTRYRLEVETHPYEIVVRLEQDIIPLTAQERRIFIKSTAATFYRINDFELALNALPGKYEIGLMVGNWVAATRRVVVPWTPTMEWPSPSGSVSRSFLVRYATGKGISIEHEETPFPDYTLTPLIGDVDGDGSPDLILMDGREMQIFDMSGRVVEVQLDSEARGGIIADLNGDGISEVLVVERREVQAFSHLTNLWNFKAENGEEFTGAAITPVGREKWLVITARSSVYSLTPEGTLKWKLSLGGELSPPAMSDIDNDGEFEAVVAVNLGNKSEIFAVDEGGTPSPIISMNAGVREILVSDIGGDGTKDLVMLCNSGLYIKSGENIVLILPDAYPPAIADIDGDSRIDVVASSKEGILTIVTAEGVRKFSLGFEAASPPVVVDLKNETSKILLGDYQGRLHLIDLEGTATSTIKVSRFPVRGVYPVDLDSDGRLEVVFTDLEGVHVLSSGHLP